MGGARFGDLEIRSQELEGAAVGSCYVRREFELRVAEVPGCGCGSERLVLGFRFGELGLGTEKASRQCCRR